MSNKTIKIITAGIAFSLGFYILFFHQSPFKMKKAPSFSTDSVLMDKTITKTEFIVRGMVCESCSQKIERHLMAIKGVKGIEIAHDSERVLVFYEKGSVSTIHLMTVISELGYTVDLAQGSGKLKVIDYKFSY